MWVDLSHPLATGMPVWPGDPEVVLTPAATTASHGFNLLAVELGSQSGTHVDAPFHVDDSLPRLDELPLDRFAGPAIVADLRGHCGAIGPDHLPALRPGAVLLLCTGHDARWGTEAYARHPWLDPAAAQAIVAAGVRTVGIDAPSIDPSTDPSEPATPALPAHHVLARAHAVIAENLTNLAALLNRDAEVHLFPLPLAHSDGAPVRAIARLWQSGAHAERMG